MNILAKQKKLNGRFAFFMGVYMAISGKFYYNQILRIMPNTSVSVFQVMTQIQTVLKSYIEKNSFYNEIKSLYDDIGQIQINSQTVFQQLIANQQKVVELKYMIYTQIQKETPKTSELNALYIQRPTKIKCSDGPSNVQQQIQQILRKICAIKSQATFASQELSIQQLHRGANSKEIQTIEQLSLRKLMKIYLKKSKVNPKMKIQNLTPLCIRLIVLQQSIMLYLQKSVSLLYRILVVEEECQIPKSSQSLRTLKTVSSLSMSIEHFLQKQQKSRLYDTNQTVDDIDEEHKYTPIIRSDFNLYQKNDQINERNSDKNQRRDKCCIWF